MRIVLVDPSRAVQRAMTHLIGDGGHEVIAFADGLEALGYLMRDISVRTLITSTQPFNISGIDLCSAAHKLRATHRALHVILMSSTDDYHLAVAALDNGADDFIHKPPIPEELCARLRLADRITLMKQELIQYATTDPLTGLLNRRAFFDNAKEMCQVARNGKSLSAIMFDIDHFKQINDTYGHETGDQVLAAVAAQAKMTDSITSRLGGEEFCVLTYRKAADALESASDLQQSLRALRFEHEGQVFSVTSSFGIAQWEQNDALDRMLRRADQAMYEAKKSGRDRIVLDDTYVLTWSHEEWRGVVRAGLRVGEKCGA